MPGSWRAAGPWQGSLRVALPVLLLAALVNPAFNHAGVTILIYLPSGNPLTLESILYGRGGGDHAVRRGAVVRVLSTGS